MSEKSFRLSIVLLLAVFVLGSLLIGYRLAEQVAQNGRFVQYDLQKASRPEGASTVNKYENWAVDTRSGQVVVVGDPVSGR